MGVKMEETLLYALIFPFPLFTLLLPVSAETLEFQSKAAVEKVVSLKTLWGIPWSLYGKKRQGCASHFPVSWYRCCTVLPVYTFPDGFTKILASPSLKSLLLLLLYYCPHNNVLLSCPPFLPPSIIIFKALRLTIRRHYHSHGWSKLSQLLWLWNTK